MSDWLAPVIAGGAQLVGSWLGNQTAADNQNSANATNTQISREQSNFQRESNATQMAFQERMSGSAHQREVADLRAAGLNPNLSAGGTGSSSPGGASSAGASTTVQPLPTMQMPDFMQIASLLQNQQRIDNEAKMIDPKIKALASDTELTAQKTKKEGKGMARAQAENMVWQKAKSILEKSKVPTLPKKASDVGPGIMW